MENQKSERAVKANQRITFDEPARSPQAGGRQNKNVQFVKTTSQNVNTLLNAVSIGDLKLFYRHKENPFNDFAKEVLLPYKQSMLGPVISKGDLNKDGLEDLFVGGAAGQAGQVFIQKNGVFIKENIAAFIQDKNFEDMEAAIFDYDGDGDNDIYVVSGGNEFEPGSEWYADRLYRNDGVGSSTSLGINFTKVENKWFTENAASGKAVSPIDFDKDGDLDLLVGNRIRPQSYPTSAPSVLYKNENGNFEDVTKQYVNELLGFGIINDIAVTDFNGDGWQDFIVVGEWTGIGLFENQKGQFKNIANKSNLDQIFGWWFSVGETDINNDGKKDYLVGNLGVNSKYKASEEKPLKVFANDFDDNGSLDIVLSSKYKEEYVPFRGRECSSEQMPFIKEKFPTYDEFAKASIEDIYGDKLRESVAREVNTFQSVLLINKGGGKFELQTLPILAQTLPILDMAFYDFDKDGYEDVMVAGNIYHTEVETPRLDNAYGYVLRSNQKNNYQTISPHQSGFFLSGDVKSLENLSISGSNYLLVAKNNDVFSLFKVNSY